MKKILPIIIALIVVGLAVAGYFFRKDISSYILRLNYIQFDGQVISWDPGSSRLKVLAAINGKNIILNLSADPSTTGTSVLEDKAIIQSVGKNVFRTIKDKADPLYQNAFCPRDKVQITTTRSKYSNLKPDNEGFVDAIDNIGERNCS